MITLLLCGGDGSRLWPVSRRQLPKQFLPLFDQGTLFQAVVSRNRAVSDGFMVAAGREQAFLAFEQLAARGISERKGVLEPLGRSTAPAVALAALDLPRDALMLVTPSDHLVLNFEPYQQAVGRAVQLADAGRLVTLGISPTWASTGYGYIEHDGETVLSFHEKPDSARAAAWLETGRYLWNSGIFCFRAGVFLDELEQHAPEVFKACREVHTAARLRAPDSALLEPTLAEMQGIPAISVDYAVMERSPRVSVVPCDIGWSDLGSFDSLYPVAYDSDQRNSVLTETAPLFIDSHSNLVISPGKKKVVLIDTTDTCVVDTEDALLVMRRGSGQRVGEAVEALEAENSPLVQSHTTVQRPWGEYTVLLDTDRVKVKRIIVSPGRRISLQKHRYREEHWVCIDGSGVVTLDGAHIPVTRTVEVHIPSGAVHRLENSGTEPLVIIETQIGSYFGEDDIIRLEDDYQRA